MGQIGYFFNIIFTFPILNILMFLDHVFGDFGLSIIVLTLVVRLCLFPLTLKQLRSTKATQAIQPLMADVRKKYPDQREQYAEMQRLYKEYKINPMAGCLPLLVQLPILYGMYGAMRTVLTPSGGHISLAQINALIYPFLPKFQVMPDFLLRWFTFLNPHWFISLAVSDPTHILPVMAGLATFAQLRMSQARVAQQRASGGKQADMMTQQMQIMSFVMPFITFFIALNFPAGLALYWTTTSVFSMVQQYFVTGWGSLFTLPSFLGGSGGSLAKPKDDYKVSTSETRRERASLDKVVDSDAEVMSEKSARTTSNSYPNSNGSSMRRRRPNSASARRRGNVPKRNASRS